MDMWPSSNSYEELMSLPDSILNSEKAAVILPCVFIQNFEAILSNCTSLLDCAIATVNVAPKNKKELRDCVIRNVCSHRKRKAVQHLYVNNNWYRLPGRYARMKCFANELQEPYVMVKYSKDMLLFDERFVNYGCNKVQWINLLRLSGYEFYVLTKAFAFDIVHRDSSYRTAYMHYARAGLMNDMGKFCRRFLWKSKLVLRNGSRVNICSDLYA